MKCPVREDGALFLCFSIGIDYRRMRACNSLVIGKPSVYAIRFPFGKRILRSRYEVEFYVHNLWLFWFKTEWNNTTLAR